jgi:general secretion pathway protein G
VRRKIATVLILAAIVGSRACAQRRLHQKEARLRETLLVLRMEIRQFTLDKQQPPMSLSELVTSGYMKEIPVDPFTGKNDSWKMKKIGVSVEIHSGSDAIASNGSAYSSW